MKVKTALILAAATSVVADVRGVAPEDQGLYKAELNDAGEKTWSCISDPSIVLSYDQINDDYCDCPDGLDEPGTSACSTNLKPFYCKNDGHVPGYLDHFKVNDGVCDYDICCDGLDEFASGKCPNKCAKVSKQFKKYRTQKRLDIQHALVIQEIFVEQAQAIRNGLQSKVVEMGYILAAKRVELEHLRSLLDDAVAQQNQPEQQVFQVVSPAVKKLEAAVAAQEASFDALQKQVAELEAVLASLAASYNPNFNDPAVKLAVSKYQEYASNKKAVSREAVGPHLTALLGHLEKISLAVSPNVVAPEPEAPKNWEEWAIHYATRFSIWAFETLERHNIALPMTIHNMPRRVPVTVEEITADIEKVERDIVQLEKDSEAYAANLNKDYGPDDVLRALALSWVSKKLGEYDYKIELLKTIYQDDTLIGEFSHYEDGKLMYTNGSKCWNGPNRKGVIHLVCDKSTELLSLSEPEKCEYHFQMTSPIVCKPLSEEELLAEFKVDRNLL